MHDLARDDILEHLALVADWLQARHPEKRFEIVIAGGAALILLGIKATTKDVDVLRPLELAPEVGEAVRGVAKAKRLSPDWVNTGVAHALGALARSVRIPDYFNDRSAELDIAPNLRVVLVARQALISMKLLAASPSQRKHVDDLRSLAPTPDELRKATAFVQSVDSSTGGTKDLATVLQTLGFDDDDGQLHR